MMPIYEYEHLDRQTLCKLGWRFELLRSMNSEPLIVCPECSKSVTKRISAIAISAPKTNSELKNMGFTKLVKRDTGVYENVTARSGDNRYVYRDKPETMPDLSKTIKD
jgi:putative FmdB family regulatory protein